LAGHRISQLTASGPTVMPEPAAPRQREINLLRIDSLARRRCSTAELADVGDGPEAEA